MSESMRRKMSSKFGYEYVYKLYTIIYKYEYTYIYWGIYEMHISLMQLVMQTKYKDMQKYL